MASPRAGMRPYLRSLAGWAWNRQNEAELHGLSLQEETLTEMLLLRIAKECRPLGLEVRMFTRDQESRNGADWEWFFHGPHCAGIGYRVQAKRLFHAGKYRGQYGSHDPNGSQTATLIAQAGKAKIPIYIFYNNSASAVFNGRSSQGFRGPSFWGCSYAAARSVKAAHSRKPSDLVVHMRPWHELFDDCMKSTKATVRPSIGSETGGADGIDGSSPGEEPSSEPEWVQMLEIPEQLEAYMQQHELAGVAYFDARDADLDWSIE